MYVGDLLCKEVLGRDGTNLKEASDYEGFPGGVNGNEPAFQGWRLKRCRFDLWVKKIPWRTAWQSTPVFLSGESHGERSLVSYSPQSKRVGHD